jgi:hypothetical protein
VKCKLLINVKYFVIIFVIYQREKVNHMNNKNTLTFMKVKDEIEVKSLEENWVFITGFYD